MGNNKTQVFTPAGGMNQDDSVLVPTPDYAGRNAFAQGDYKYALNSRIGSSRSDNFGDLEILKGTTEVTAYKVRSIVNTNSDFSSGLTGWSQVAVSGGVAWVNSFGIGFAFGVGSSVSDILYQDVAPFGKRMGIGIKVSIPYLASSSSIVIHFMNGSTILQSQTIITDQNEGGLASHVYAKYMNIELPSGCNRIGMQAFATSLIGGSSIAINYFQFFDWIAGTRPTGIEKVIGKYENKEFNTIYYHVYNASGNHCLRAYDPVAAVIFEILQWSGLDYASTYFESSAMVDNFIGWTDRNNSPRMVDVYSIGDLMLILGSDFREYHISFHRWAPTLPPVLRAYYDSVTNNYLKFENKDYQFAYREIYQNHLRSRWSPVSGVGQNFVVGSGSEITSIEIFIPGSTLDDPGVATQYNYFNNDDIKFTSVVEEIEIAYREGQNDVWRLFNRMPIRVSGNTSAFFGGDSNSTPVATDDFYQLFDTVPFLAGAIEAIDNRFMFADCLDEKDTAPPVQVTDVGVAKFDASQTVDNWWNFGVNNQATMAALYTGVTAPQAGDIGLRNMINDTTFKSRGIYKPGIVWLHKNGWRSAVYTVDNWSYEIAAETSIIDKFYALMWKFPSTFIPPDWAVGYQIVLTNCLNIESFLFGAANSFAGLIDDATQIATNAQTPQDIRDASNKFFEDARSIAGLNFSKVLSVIRNKSFFKSIGPAVRKTSNAASLANASRLFIDINNWYNSSKADAPGTQNNPINKLFYNYTEGDRVRFLGSTLSATPTNAQKKIFDVQILEFTGNGIIIEKPIGLLWVPIGVTTGDQRPTDLLIEVYTPKTPVESDFLYYERGEWYPVLYPGTDQRDMAKRDWTWTDTTTVTCAEYGDIRVFSKRPFSNGDCHGIQKAFYFNRLTSGTVNTGDQNVTSMNPDPNKSFGLWEQNDGRIYAAYRDLPVVKFKTTMIRFGGQVVEQSFVNQLNRFKEENNKIYPSEYGRIRAIVNTANAQVESVGSILFAIGEREAFSIYINRATLEDLSGNTQVSLSDKVLGSYNTLLGSHGTMNPESVTLDRGRVYYWDALYGCWVRYGRDGLTEISFYKMRNWFRELADLLLPKYGTSEEPLVISSFDSFNQELVLYMNHSTLPVTFRDYATYKGTMFSEEDTRWKSVHSYDPERFAKLNNLLISFKGGSLFLHEQNATRLTFYGSKKDAMIEPVFNDGLKDEKVFQAIATVSSHKWSALRLLSEYRGAKTKRESFLSLDKFDEREDGYYAAIGKDINTPNVTNPVFNGDDMRSRSLRALMKLDPDITTESLLQYVEMLPIDSPRNP